MLRTMRFLLVILFPLVGFSQAKLDSISILNGKVTLRSPKELTSMSDEMWALKYRNRPRPVLALGDDEAEVNLIGDMTEMAAKESQMKAFKDFQIEDFKKKRGDVNLLGDGVKIINGKNVGYIKFVSQAIDQKVFNYFFFIIVDGKIMMFNFNCIERLQKKWEASADNIVASLRVK